MKGKFQEEVPVITVILVILNIGIWLFMEITGDTQDVWYMLEHGA